MDFLLKFSRNRESILLRKNLAYLMHLATYSKDPSTDGRSLLVRTIIRPFLHKSLMIDNLSAGVDAEKFSVLTIIPRYVT